MRDVGRRGVVCAHPHMGRLAYKCGMYELSAPAQGTMSSPMDPHGRASNVARRLLSLAAQCRSHGMSGRSLRRLPVLALARYISVGNITESADVETWLNGMERVVTELVKEKEHLE